MLTFVSLFSGVGGFDLGLERAGWRCVAQVEWDKQCQAVLARHWPDVPRWADVADVRGDELPPADVVAFGSPCQDLSVAGRRAGFVEGGRSNLFFEAIRIIKEMRDATDGTLPRFVIWENVVGALSSNQGADFAAVIDALAEIGAVDIGWRVLDARWCGVPQRRRRVFVVADLAGRCAGAVSVEPEGVRWDLDEGGASWSGDPDGTARGVASGGVYGQSGFARYTEGVTPLRATDHKRPEDNIVIGGNQVPGVLTTHTHTTALTAGLASGGPDAAHACAGWLVSERTGHCGPAAGVAGRATDDRCGRCDLGGGAVSELSQSWTGGAQQDQFVALDDVASTLAHSSNTHSGHHQPMVMLPDPLPFSKAGRARSVDDGETWVPGEVSPTLNAFDNGTESRATVVAVVQDGREIDKRQNGLGITDGAAPAYTLDQTGAQAVAVSQNQRGEVVETDYAHQLTTGGGKPGDGYPAARTGTVVRRLTPLECERLMGWPDDHTRWRADGTEVSDSARYRMCGNGVASPVAAYIAACINRALEQEATDAA